MHQLNIHEQKHEKETNAIEYIDNGIFSSPESR